MRNVVTFIASLALLAACSRKEEPQGKQSTWKPGNFRTHARPPAEPGVVLVDVTAAAGIDFVHENGAAGKKYLPETMGSGVALFDYDGDGDLDILFVQSRRWSGEAQPTLRLYRNDGGWRFRDVTEGSGLEVVCYGMGVAVADYDADGDLDLYITCLGPNLLFNNQGKRFVRVEGAPDGGTWTEGDDGKKKNHSSWSTGAGWFDADEDGDLDLLVVSYVRWTPATDLRAQAVEGVKAYIRPELYAGDSPRLYLQQADGSFLDATQGSGFDRTKVAGKSMALCFDDFNGDGHIDVFVANDTVQNFLFLGRGGGRFSESAISAGVALDADGRARAGMGVASLDWRNDGRLGIAVGNFSEEAVSLYSVAPGTGRRVFFQDDANAARIGTDTLLPLTFGLLMVDLDLDGWCDMVLSNGHIEPSITRLKPELQYEQSPQFFRNLGGKEFRDLSTEAGRPFSQRIVGRGLASGDLDGDGDLDLVFTSNGGKPMVLRCDRKGENRFLRLRLSQPGSKNPDALGAIVRVTVAGITQRRMVRTAGSYLSQGETTLTFGLGTEPGAEKVVVTWPDGTRQAAGALAAGSHLIKRRS